MLLECSAVAFAVASSNHLQDDQQPEPVAPACTAYSHPIYALILLYTPPDPPQAPISVPLRPSDPLPSSLTENYPRPLLPNAPQATSDAFQLTPSWVWPLNSMSEGLQQIIHASLHYSCRTTNATGRRLTPASAVDVSQGAPLHPDAAPPPSHPLPSNATPLETQQHQAFLQPHGQQGPPAPDSPKGPLKAPHISLSHDHLSQAGTKPAADRDPAQDSTVQAGRQSAEAEEPLRGRQLRGKGEALPAGQAEQQLEQQCQQQQQQQPATFSSKQQLHQDASSLHRPSLVRREAQHDNSGGQLAFTAAEGKQGSPQAQQGNKAAGAAAVSQNPRQTAAASLTEGLSDIATPRPDPTAASPSGAIAKTDSEAVRPALPGGQARPGSKTPEPPSRGKRPEAEEGIEHVDPSASHLLLGKPKMQKPTPSSPAAPTGATALRPPGTSAAARGLPGKPTAQRLNSRAATPTAATGEASTLAAAPQLPAEDRAQGASPPERQAQTAAQAPAQAAATQSKPQQRKRVYRQSLSAAAEEAAPQAKRSKQAAAQVQVQVQSEASPPAPQPQQQQRQQSQETKAAPPRKVREPIRHPEQPIDLPPSAVQNIYRSIRKLRLQGNGQHSPQLSSQHMDLMKHLPPLLQLRVLSKYASEVLPHGNVVKFFTLTVEAMARRRDVKWLTQRDETDTAYRLCDAAASLYGRLGDSGELPAKTVPTKTPQMVPLELQAAYILCIGGYTGSLSRREFADQLLVGLLGQVCITMQELKASASDVKTAELNLKAAAGSLAKVHERLKQSAAPRGESQRAQHATGGAKPAPLDIGGVVQTCFAGLTRLNRPKDGFVDDRSMNFLQTQGPLWQLRIVSFFACHLRRPSSNASAFLTTICKHNRNDSFASKLDWLRSVTAHLDPQTQSMLDQTYKAGMLPREKQVPAKIAVLPRDLHYAAACYAVGVQTSDPSCKTEADAASLSNPTTAAVDDFVRFAQGLIHEADPAALPHYTRSESASRSASRGASRAGSQPPKNDQVDRTAARHNSQQGAAAGTHPAPADPRARPQTQPPNPQASASRQPGSGVHQTHVSHVGSWPRHCKYFYRMDGGCMNRQCDYYHGSHQEYVAYMVHCGLVPYSLKFASEVGRDKWIADAAVDGLNDMILSQQLPRGSFSECDLRPLAFLQDPSGDQARMQLRVRTASLPLFALSGVLSLASCDEQDMQLRCCCLWGPHRSHHAIH